jgi:hypothetical protein
MNRHGHSGGLRRVCGICAALFVLHVFSVAVLAQENSQKKNPLNVTLAHGNVIQDPPLPAIPDDQTQNCPPWETMRPPKLGKYLPCPVVAQAGVPFNGWIATQALCGGDAIDSIGALIAPFTSTGPLGATVDPNTVFTEEFDIYYNAPGPWPDKEHLAGSHVWQVPGQWSISGTATVICVHNGPHFYYNFPMGGQATVYAATAPKSITALGTKSDPGQAYHNFGRVTLFDKAPASGSLVKLMTDKPAKLPKVIDVQTQFATTGLQLGTDIVYLSTYIYIPPGQQYADFDLLVAASAQPGEIVEISAKCVGEPRNWVITNHCDEVNLNPQILRVTITRP